MGEAVGVNAIEKAVYLLISLQRLEEEWGRTKAHPLFKPGHFVLHPGVIDGGPGGIKIPLVVSDYCHIHYAIWYPPQDDVDEVKREIEDYSRKAAASSSPGRRPPLDLIYTPIDGSPFIEKGKVDSLHRRTIYRSNDSPSVDEIRLRNHIVPLQVCHPYDLNHSCQPRESC